MDVTESVQSLFDVFPVKTATENTVRQYIADLDDLPEPLVVEAIAHLRRTSTFLPTIGEIRMLVVERACGLPSEEAAWNEVKAAMAASFPGSGPWQVSPLVLEVVKSVGTWELRNDPDGKSVQRFRAIYRERRAAVTKEMAAGTLSPLAYLPAPERLAVAG